MSSQQPLLKCPACFSPALKNIMQTCRAMSDQNGKTIEFFVCSACNFHFAPKNTHVYSSRNDFAQSSDPMFGSGRVGSDLAPGREYQMAHMALEIMRLAGSAPISILIFGAGLSKDHEWLRRSLPNIKVCVCDLCNFQNTDHFIPADSSSRFDIVVACECIEHFTNIEANFSILLSKVSSNGLAVFSTNINDGSDITMHSYPFIAGHTSYYSGRALQHITKRFDESLNVDFRLPNAALGQLGSKKRYVLTYSSPKIGAAISEYFASHITAPSEAIIHSSFHYRLRRFLRRLIFKGGKVTTRLHPNK